MKFVNITIDDKKVAVPEGMNLIEAAKRIGIDIPNLCYDKDLEVVSACRLCVVEVVGTPKLVTACSTPAMEGMVVYTETEKIVNARKVILRLLLDNHPNDCLTCQKAGECQLQKYAYRYDVKFRIHDGARRGGEEASFTDTSSPYILRDESKCILCGKCVRTCAVVDDRHVLTFAERGFVTKIAADADQTLEESTCVSCNRCVVACPVGALLDRRITGVVRPWESNVQGIKCKSCDYGCNMEILSQNNKVLAVRARSPQESRPLCLKGRLMTTFEYNPNPGKAYKKVKTEEGRRFVEVSWVEAMELEGVYAKLIQAEKSKEE